MPKTYSLLSYHQPWVERTIYRTKYDGVFSYAEILGQLMARNQEERLWNSKTMVCAVPVHRSKLLDRGFDQAAVLARAFASATRLSYLPVLRRTHKTIPQFQNTATQRLENMQDAFSLVPRISPLVIRNKTVILIDDVITTGATLAEASRILYTADAAEVICIAAAFSEKSGKS